METAFRIMVTKLIRNSMLFLCLGSVSLLSAEPVTRMRFVMGTTLKIGVSASDSQVAEKAADAAFREVERIDRLLSNYKEDSEISQINREAYPESAVTTSEVRRFLMRSLEISRMTDGAFDITIEPLTRLWRLREKDLEEAPDKKKAGKVSFKVNYKNLEVYRSDNSVRFLVEDMGLDTGGIGKGYALDMALERIRELPVDSAVLNFGGEILYWSKDARERMIAVRNPLDKNRVWRSIFFKTYPATAAAVSTSGNYERFFIFKDKGKGRRIGHILDPVTGMPVDHEVRSVTVVSPNAMEADALSTAIFIMGLEKGRRFAEKLQDHWVLILYENDDGTLGSFMSSEWKKYVTD